MKNLKTDEGLHTQLEALIAHFHSELKKGGYPIKLSKLTFHARANDLVCTCGYDVIIDPKTGKVIRRQCRRCPSKP